MSSSGNCAIFNVIAQKNPVLHHINVMVYSQAIDFRKKLFYPWFFLALGFSFHQDYRAHSAKVSKLEPFWPSAMRFVDLGISATGWCLPENRCWYGFVIFSGWSGEWSFYRPPSTALYCACFSRTMIFTGIQFSRWKQVLSLAIN